MTPYTAKGAELCRTMPYTIQFVVTRAADDAHSGPVICRWTAWSSLAKGHFLLLHETASGALEPVDVGMLQGMADRFYRPGHGEETIAASNSEVWEMMAGGSYSPICNLTANYQTRLVPGETYHLLWPGGEIKMWEWGSMNELMNTKLKSRAEREEPLPLLVLPPAAGIKFEVMEAEDPFPDRQKYIRSDGPHVSYDTANRMEKEWRREQERLRNSLARTSPEPLAANKRV